MKFTEFEQAALASFTSYYGEDEAIGLGAQLAAARPTSRENSGGRFFTDLAVDRQVASPVSCPSPLDGQRVFVAGLKGPLELLLFFEDGYARLLEGYSVEGDSTSSVDFETASFSEITPMWPKKPAR